MTFLEAVTEVQRQGDFENDPHKGATEIKQHIIRAYRMGWSILLSAARTYFIKTKTFTLAGGTAGQTVTVTTDLTITDFYEALKLERDDGSGEYRQVVWPVEILERHSRDLDRGWLLYDHPAKITVEPPSRAAGNYRLWYVYRPADLANDADVIVDPLGLLEQFIIDTAVLRLDVKEETDSTALKSLRDELRTEARRMATARFFPRTAVAISPRRYNFQTRRSPLP